MTRLSHDYDVESSPGYWICTTAHAIERSFNEELAPYGITFRQAQVVGWLVLEPGISQAELARRMNVEAPTLHGILTRMERDGWVERGANPADRRCKLLRLCDGIRPEWERIVTCARRVRAKAVRGLSPRQLATLLRALGTIRSNLDPEETSR